MELKKNKKIYYSVISVCLLICAAVSRELAREEDGILLVYISIPVNRLHGHLEPLLR